MNKGDKVTGVPANPDMLADYPTVTGTYSFFDHQLPPEFGGDTRVEFIRCPVSGSSDYSAIDVVPGSVVPAGRREKETVVE